MQAPVCFSEEQGGRHAWLANGSWNAIQVGGQTYYSVDHFFFSQQFAGTVREQQICQAPSGWDARRMAAARDIPVRADWDQVKEQIMLIGLWAKYTQHAMLRDSLLNTGNAPLVEESKDTYWGVGKHGDGYNRIGVLLMYVRDCLRAGTSPWPG